MRRKVKDIEEALEVLETLCVNWITTNKIENSLWEKGVAFSIEVIAASLTTMRHITNFQFT